MLPVLVSTCGSSRWPRARHRAPPGVSSSVPRGDPDFHDVGIEADFLGLAGLQQGNFGLGAQQDAGMRRPRPAFARLLGALKMDAHAGSRSAASASARQARPEPARPRAARFAASRRLRSWGKTGSSSNLQACVSIFRNQGGGNDEAARRSRLVSDARVCVLASGKGRSVVQLDVELHRGLAPGLSSPTLQVTDRCRHWPAWWPGRECRPAFP